MPVASSPRCLLVLSSFISIISAANLRNANALFSNSSTTAGSNSTSTSFVTDFTTSTANQPTATAFGTGSLPIGGLASASACNLAKLSWVSNSGQVFVSNRTFTTSTSSISYTIINSGYIETVPTNPVPYTLCDGWPRVNASTTEIIINTTPTKVFWSTFVTTTAVSGNASAPTCVSPVSACAVLNSQYISQSSAYSQYVEGLNSGITTFSSVAFPTSPICGNATLTAAPSTMLAPAACLMETATIQLLYWPVATVGNHLCGGNYSTITATPTVPGKANTAVLLNTTFTSPTVYMVLSGAYSVGDNFAVGSAVQGILPLSSTVVSSMCGKIGGGFGAPVPVSYADFNSPVPASAYRCQPDCFTIPNFPQYWSISGWNATATENLCSTIFDGYAPALAVPTAEFNSFFSDLSNGLGIEEDGLQCSFSPAPGGILYDPPRALQQAQTVAGVSVPASAGTTLDSTPQTTPASPSKTLAPPVPDRTTPPAQQTSKIVQPDPSLNPPPSLSPGSSSIDAPQPADSSQPAKSTSSLGIGGIIASVLGLTKSSSGRPISAQTAVSTQGQSNIGQSPQQPANVADPSSIPSPLGPSSSGPSPAQSAAAADPTLTSQVQDPVPSAGSSDSSSVGNGADLSAGDPVVATGAVITGLDGQSTTAVISGGSIILPQATLSVGATTSMPGIGELSAGASGIVHDGTTLSFVPLGTPVAPGPGSGASAANGITDSPSPASPTGANAITIAGQAYSVDPGGNIILGPGTTLTPGGVATISGITLSLAPSASAIVVNGQTSSFRIPVSVHGAELTVGGKTYTQDSEGGFVFGSSATLTPGGVVIVSGTTISLGPSAIVVNGQTSSLPSPATGQAAELVIGSKTYIENSEGDVVFGLGTTLVPGGVVTVSGTTISLEPSASGAVAVVNGLTKILTVAVPSSTGEPGRTTVEPSRGQSSSLRMQLAILALSSVAVMFCVS